MKSFNGKLSKYSKLNVSSLHDPTISEQRIYDRMYVIHMSSSYNNILLDIYRIIEHRGNKFWYKLIILHLPQGM